MLDFLNYYLYNGQRKKKGNQKMKDEFLEILKQVKREGIEQLINFLEKSDFFIAPASTRFHGNHEGGLVEHSIKVYEILKHKVQNCIQTIEIPESVIEFNGIFIFEGCDRLVLYVKADSSYLGKIVNVKITSVKTWSMDGEII